MDFRAVKSIAINFRVGPLRAEVRVRGGDGGCTGAALLAATYRGGGRTADDATRVVEAASSVNVDVLDRPDVGHVAELGN